MSALPLKTKVWNRLKKEIKKLKHLSYAVTRRSFEIWDRKVKSSVGM